MVPAGTCGSAGCSRTSWCAKPKHVGDERGCKPKDKKKQQTGTHEEEQMRVCPWQERERDFFGIYDSFRKVEFRYYEPGNSMLFAESIQRKMAFV